MPIFITTCFDLAAIHRDPRECPGNPGGNPDATIVKQVVHQCQDIIDEIVEIVPRPHTLALTGKIKQAMDHIARPVGFLENQLQV
jgi:hypothetical protein